MLLLWVVDTQGVKLPQHLPIWGARTLLITMDMTKFAQMSCNPAMGGVAKGQIIREIDAIRWLFGHCYRQVNDPVQDVKQKQGSCHVESAGHSVTDRYLLLSGEKSWKVLINWNFGRIKLPV